MELQAICGILDIFNQLKLHRYNWVTANSNQPTVFWSKIFILLKVEHFFFSNIFGAISDN